MSAYMNGGIADEKTLKLRDRDQSPRRRGSGDNKTVRFGDPTSVRSLPLWSFMSAVLLVAGWWAVTKAWGYPDEFRQMFQDAEVDGTLRDRQLFELCLRDAQCDPDSYTQLVSPLIFPSVRDTWNAAGDLFAEGYRNVPLLAHSWASLWRVLQGVFWGSAVGIPVGLAMALSGVARGFFDTVVESFRPIPPLALLPLFTLTFGLGEKTAVPLLVFASIWIMIIAARAGIKNTQLSKVRAAYSLGASRRQLLTQVLIPNALPEIFVGLRVALGVSWGTLVAAELSGVQEGLGAMISIAKNFSRLDVIIVGIVIILLLGIMLDLVVRVIESLAIPWQGKG